MARQRLTDHGVKALKPRAGRYAHPDPECVGHYILIQPSGVKTYKACGRTPHRKQVWATLGRCDHLSIDEARAKAREAIARIKAGQPAIEPPPPAPASFRAVAESWLQRHVRAKRLRSSDAIEWTLSKYIYPTLADREIGSIRKSDVTMLLDHIEDGHGRHTSDSVLATLSRVLRWHETRVDDYTAPITRGMRKTSMRDTARKRILDDDEIRAVWARAEASGAFGAVVMLLLLTAQRRDKVCSMRWDDVAVDGTWNIPSEEREKGNAGVLVLPEVAIEIIRQQPRIESSPYVFTGRSNGYLSGYSGHKAKLDSGLPPMPPWTLHDLRRTARSLMSRTGVRPDVAERVLGHVQGGVLGTYDRHSYRDEKADALRRLAALITEIVKGSPDKKVVPIRARS